MYDFVIVGAGLFGAVFAREMTDAGYKCLLIDQRDHIGGNVYTEKVEGIDVHKYGAHIFHTNDKRIWEYVNKFAEFNHYINKPKVRYKDRIYSFPINLMTLYQIYGVTTPKEAEEKLNEIRLPIDEPANLEEWILSQVGPELYELFIKGYTFKQWQKHPKDLPSFIIKRLPIRLNFEENYFEDSYQGIPKNGYTAMVENMLEGIEVRLNENYFDNKSYYDNLGKQLVYTGKIDEFFNYEFGELEYRSLRFESKVLDGNYQGNAVFNYTDIEVPYTRVLEHKHFNFGNQKKTVVTWEYPDSYTKGKVPYYPINDAKNSNIYKLYEAKTKDLPNIIFGGRLAEYKYYDMHQIVGSALSKAKSIKLKLAE
ncbi:UDP-galactopyranose mutase [Pontibacter cellulosilyticus]|uniref:UDP-galactopyranose mutase n=1 Tax=Pontibacter cellulosilyticus TaxID=1720253 RepID=A0A923N4J8_9BACT|nr:UDP-galactopyranose mutase [Pontibacter cellulosilyticus]MBC5992106.1 UDP-galactopyranose mutase [Pontibacter cellulosilyticus]